MADDFAEAAVEGVFRVDVGRVDVAGHDGEQLDVLLGERAHQGGAVARLDVLEGAIFNDVHVAEPTSKPWAPVVAFDPMFIFAVFNKMRIVAPQASRGRAAQESGMPARMSPLEQLIDRKSVV